MRHAFVLVGLLSGFAQSLAFGADNPVPRPDENRYVFKNEELPYVIALFRVPDALKEFNKPGSSVTAAWKRGDERDIIRYHYIIKQCDETGCNSKTLTVAVNFRPILGDGLPTYTAYLDNPLTPAFIPNHPLFLKALTALLKSSEQLPKAREFASAIVSVISENVAKSNGEHTFVLGHQGGRLPKAVTGVLYVTETGDGEGGVEWRGTLVGGKD